MDRQSPSETKGKLFLAVPAVGAQLAGGQTDCLDHVVQALEGKGSELHLLANFLDHGGIFGGIRVGVELKLFPQLLLGQVAFETGDHAARDQIQLGLGAGEVQVFAAAQDR